MKYAIGAALSLFVGIALALMGLAIFGWQAAVGIFAIGMLSCAGFIVFGVRKAYHATRSARKDPFGSLNNALSDDGPVFGNDGFLGTAGFGKLRHDDRPLGGRQTHRDGDTGDGDYPTEV